MNVTWERRTLGEVLQLRYGKALASEFRSPDGDFPAYGANGVKDRSTKSLVTKPSLVVGRKGSVGEVARVSEPFWPLDVTYFVEHDDSATDLGFLYYLLVWLQLPRLARGVKPGLNRHEAYALEVPIPQIKDQQRIAALLDKAFADTDAAFVAMGASSKLTEEISQSYVNDVLSKRDSNWMEVQLRDICQVDWGNTNLTKKAYVPDGAFLAVSASGGDGRIDRMEHKAGTPVLSAIGAQCGRMFLPGEDFTAIKNTITLTPIKDRCVGSFLYRVLSNVELPKRGAAQTFISKGDIQNFRITIPEGLVRQEEISQQITELEVERDLLIELRHEKRVKLEHFRQALLHQAFAGQL